jgi:hypothetical protein
MTSQRSLISLLIASISRPTADFRERMLRKAFAVFQERALRGAAEVRALL